MEKLELIPDPGFWADKKVLLTGHTGFKGSWLAIWLHSLGAKVSGLALPPETAPNLFSLANISELVDSSYCDIREAENLHKLVAEVQPDIVLHLAAQALVRKSYRQPFDTFGTNVMGTVNLLEAIRLCPGVRVAVMVTTDKVYEITNSGKPFTEYDRLGGYDPYSASKAASELIISSYRNSFLASMDLAVATARAGNVIGGGDWSEDRLIPDAIRAWRRDETLAIRMPEAIRPWQHVLDPLCGYLILAERLWSDPSKSTAYNFGPEDANNASVREVIEMARTYYQQAKVHYGQATGGMHETGLLNLATDKSKQELGFSNRYKLEKALSTTFDWYRQYDAGRPARELCLHDIAEFHQGL